MLLNFIVFIFGFISGFILLISGNTLNFWLSSLKIDITAIGLFSFISIPYAICFLWSPIFDKIHLPYFSTRFGHRLSWIYFLQILLAISVYIITFIPPESGLYSFALCSFVIALFSSAQDVVIGALRSELIPQEKQGAFSGIYIFGYRVGMLISSSGAIFLSTYISWQIIYKIFALVISLFPFVLYFTLHNKNFYVKESEIKMDKSIVQSFGSYKFVLYLLIFLVLYRLPDNFINVMINPFLLEIGFKAIEIASVGKFLGIIAAILGGFIASYIMNRKTIIYSLIFFGIIHACAHSMFILQAIAGNNIILLFFVMGFESVTGGMTMASYIAFITSLCNGKYRATKYAFLTSMMGLSRSILPGISGFIVVKYGWIAFYCFVSFAAVPSIFLLYYLKNAFNRV